MTIRELVTRLGYDVNTAGLRRADAAIDRQKAKVRSLDQRWRRFQSRTINRVGQGLTGLSNRFGALNGRLESQFGSVLTPLREMGSQIPLVGSHVAGVSAGMLALGAGIAGVVLAVKGLKAATSTFMTFEEAMKGVQRVTLASADEMDALSDAAIRAASNSVFTSAQAADAQRFLAMAGFSVQETITALPGVLQLAAAAEMDLAQAADITTNVLTSNQLSVEELGRVNDVLAKTAASANTDVSALGEAFATIGNIGAIAGVEVEELSGLLGVLANNGIRGSLGGTLLRNALQDLSAPSEKVRSEMSALGIDVDNLTDATGRFRDDALVDFFDDLNQAMDTGQLKGAELMNIFGERSGRAISTFAATGREELESMLETVADNAGTVADMSEIAFRGLTGSIEEFRSKSETATVGFFEHSGLDKLFADVVRMLSDVIPPAIAYLGPALRPFVAALRGAIRVLRIPISIIGGIIRVIGDLGRAWQDRFGGGVERTLGIVGRLLDIFRAYFDLVSAKIRETGERVSTAVQALTQNASRFIGPIIDRLRGVYEFIDGLLERVANFLGRETDRIASSMAPGSDMVTNRSTTTGDVNLNNTFNISGGDGSPEAIGQAVAGAVGEQVRSQFAIELRRVLVDVSY